MTATIQGNLIKNSEARLTNIGIRGTQVVSDSKGWLKDSFSNWLRSWFTETNFFHRQFEDLSLAIYWRSSWRSARWGIPLAEVEAPPARQANRIGKSTGVGADAPSRGNWRFMTT